MNTQTTCEVEDVCNVQATTDEASRKMPDFVHRLRKRKRKTIMTELDVIEILEKDTLVYTAALHWNVARSAVNDSPPKVIYVGEFVDEIAKRILATFDPSILTKRSVIHLAHWFTEHMIREQYAQLVNKPTKP